MENKHKPFSETAGKFNNIYVCYRTGHSIIGIVFLVFAILWVPFEAYGAYEQNMGLPPEPMLSEQLQQALDRIVAKNLEKQPGLASSQVHLAVIDLTSPHQPRLAQFNGREPVYPSSVIKMVYMAYVYHVAKQGVLKISPKVNQKLYQMIHPSSNTATAWIVDLWSQTSGVELRSPPEYKAFAHRRNACNRWLRSLGITQINACQKTWGSPIPSGEKQFLRDGKPSGPWVNRNTMTAVAAARFLQLLAQNTLVDKKSCDAMRKLMVRDVRNQPYQRMRIAGGTPKGSEVYSKTGTTSDTFHDAGIVTLPNGRTFILAIFITGSYRGPFIRNVSKDLCAYFTEQKF